MWSENSYFALCVMFLILLLVSVCSDIFFTEECHILAPFSICTLLHATTEARWGKKKDFLVFIGVQLQQHCSDVITPGMSGELFSRQQWICQSWWGSTQETALSNKSRAHCTSVLYAFLNATKKKGEESKHKHGK